MYSNAKSVWTGTLRGLIAIIFGLFALFYPHDTLSFIIIIFGLYVLINGILAIIFSLYGWQYHEPDWWFYLIEGIASTIFGLIIFFLPLITGMFLIYIIAIWAIITGIIQIIAYIKLQKVFEKQTLLLISGLLSIILGVVFFKFPLSGIVTITWIIGLYALIFCIISIISVFQTKHAV